VATRVSIEGSGAVVAARGSVEGSGRLVSLTWLASLDGL
jgi:hypothetical protein